MTILAQIVLLTVVDVHMLHKVPLPVSNVKLNTYSMDNVKLNVHQIITLMEVLIVKELVKAALQDVVLVQDLMTVIVQTVLMVIY